MTEVWRKIPSVPGLLASSFGRIMVAKYSTLMANGGTRTYGGHARLGTWAISPGRFQIGFRGKNYKVHRLICEAFHGRAPQGAICMHLDEDASNNVPINLAWGTQKENLNAPGFLAYCAARTGENSPVIKGLRKKMGAA